MTVVWPLVMGEPYTLSIPIFRIIDSMALVTAGAELRSVSWDVEGALDSVGDTEEFSFRRGDMVSWI